MVVIKTFVKNSGIVCHTCGKPGHKSPDCFQGAKGAGKWGGGGGVVCNTCGRPGHKSPDCYDGPKGAGKSGGGIICNTCGRPGHKSPDCYDGPKGAGKSGGGIICNTCGRPGHKSPDCYDGAKGFGKGFGGGFGKGKGQGLRGFPSDKKVWIGGLPADNTSKDFNKKVLEHMKQAGNCKFAEVGKSGAGGAAYATAEEAASAITMLNGSTFDGSVLEVDVWTKKEKGPP